MAKIRVYEFARELNMTNRELLDKIRDLDIEVNSHMSSLDEDVVAKVKSALFGAKDDQLEEKRVRPTVIRRRRVVAPKEPEAPESEPVSAEAPESPPVETRETAPEPEKEKAPAEKKPAVKKRKPEDSAKIISKPKVEPPEEPLETAEPEAPAEEPAADATASRARSARRRWRAGTTRSATISSTSPSPRSPRSAMARMIRSSGTPSASANVRAFQLSKKKPRLSPNTRGVSSSTPSSAAPGSAVAVTPPATVSVPRTLTPWARQAAIGAAALALLLEVLVPAAPTLGPPSILLNGSK